MSISLTVLRDLGINLYSNVPAVVSEAVANAWDADAETVDIVVDHKAKRITITDDGEGMDLEDINGKYLMVGYKRREDPDRRVTPLHGRHVMGRKGIGKLSLFSIADTIELHTVKDGGRDSFRMSAKAIEDAIKKGKGGKYRPTQIKKDDTLKKGTRIVLSNLKKRLIDPETGLKKRLARRFCVIGSEYCFDISVNGSPITIGDRDYFHRIQYLWVYGTDAAETLCKDAKQQPRSGVIDDSPYRISGWIGSVKEAGSLKEGDDNLNKIVLMVRGKLAQEDILEDFSEGGIYSKYLMGEINADFLDLDDEEDIATSSRQEFIRDDPRYKVLKAFIQKELKYIQSVWTAWRNEAGTAEARTIPAVDKWYSSLSRENKYRAKNLFGKINQLTVDSPEDRKLLLKHGILAFESLKYKDNLDALDKISPDNIGNLAYIFRELDDIEATLYHQIVSERIKVIETLQEKLDDNVREKVIQQYLFKELWLLDPSWERATTETPSMEQRVDKEFAKINAGLSKEEKEGRLDIKYTTTSGKHVIVELKRADRVVDSYELIKQVTKYKDALRKVLDTLGRSLQPIEVVCVVGRDLKDWGEKNGKRESSQMLAIKGIRVIRYDELIDNAYKAYKAFVDRKREVSRIYDLLRSIDEGDLSQGSAVPIQAGAGD
ncbi:MAG: ATP-binding protein [Syntrophorhabdales bacterium]